MIVRKSKPHAFAKLLFLSVRSLLLYVGVFGLMHVSHAQIRSHKQVKKIKRNTYNFYQADRVKKKHKKNKGLYIVYSDRSQNTAYQDAYAQNIGSKQPFLQPYFVLKQENDYFKLVAYNPALIGKPKGSILSPVLRGKYTFTDAKKANYIGWIHKDQLLHYDHSRLSGENYRSVRYMLGIDNLKTLFKIFKFAKGDSVILYTDPSLRRPSGKKLMLNQIVYLYKYNKGHTAALISNKSKITDADSTDRIMGWVPKELMKYVGQQQAFNTDEIDSLVFHYNYKADHATFFSALQPDELGTKIIFNTALNKKNTVGRYDTVQVMTPVSVWDHRDNKLTNVEGNELLISDIDKIKMANKSIHFHFMFDCSETIRAKQIRLMTSLQRIWLLYTENEAYADYRFSFSASSYGCDPFYTFDKNASFPLWIDYLDKALTNDTTLKPPHTHSDGIKRCFDYYLSATNPVDYSTNIVLISGANHFSGMSRSKKRGIAKRLAQTSSRLIFFQLENKSYDSYQDYILHAKDLLAKVAANYNRFIKGHTVDNQLVKNKSAFISIPAEDNIYIYNSPEYSNYQGGIIFPKINEELIPTSFDRALDSVLIMALENNTLHTNSLDYYNDKLGFLRSKPSKYMTERVKTDSAYAKKIRLIPRNNINEQYNEYRPLCLSENLLTTGYLLSESELEVLISNYKSFAPVFSGDIKRKERRKVFKMYKYNGKNLNVLYLNRNFNRRVYISELVFMKTGIPVSNPLLQKLKVRHIKRKRKIGHPEFAALLTRLREKTDLLENIYVDDTHTTYAYGKDEKYYFIPINYLF